MAALPVSARRPHIDLVRAVNADRYPSALVIDVPAGTSPEIWRLVERVGATLEALLGAMSDKPAAVPAPVRLPDPDVDNDANPVTFLDLQARSVWRGEEEIHLTHLEFEMLTYFVSNPARAIHRNELLDNVWHQPVYHGTSRTIDVHVRRLRWKLGQALELRTVRGFGYRLDGWTATVSPSAG